MLYEAGSLISVIVSYAFMFLTLVFTIASLSTNIPNFLKIYFFLIILLVFMLLLCLLKGI